MNDASKKPSVSTNEKNVPSASQEPWRPFDTLRRQVDRLFDDFERPWHLPFSRHGLETPPLWQGGPNRMPAMDVVEKENSFEITAELPGLDEKDVEVKLAGNSLIIKGENARIIRRNATATTYPKDPTAASNAVSRCPKA